MEIHSTEVLGVKAPRLTELNERPCTLEELQAALVQLINIVNLESAERSKDYTKLANEINGKEPRQWRATI